MKTVIAIHGSPNEHAAIFGGYQMPPSKTSQAICLYDKETLKSVWVKCPHVDYPTLQNDLLVCGLLRTDAEFLGDLSTMQGEGTAANMKVLPPAHPIVMKPSKVMSTLFPIVNT